MKLYTYPKAPSPRRVHLFLAEKQLELSQHIVDLATGEQLQPDFAEINPALTVPALVLDNGTCLVEPIAICHFLEQLHPEPALFGRTPLEQAMVLERNHWVETSGLLAVMEGFRNRSQAMAGRALPGPRATRQIPELAERGVQRYRWFVEDLDRLLADSDYLAGDRFSLADITAWVALEFAAWGIRTTLPETLNKLQRWQQRISGRAAFSEPY